MSSISWRCVPGACVMIPSGPTGQHLFAVVAGPKVIDGHGSDQHVVLVGFSSIKPNIAHDPACEILPGEHPFIKKQTCIYYREPRLEKVSKVEQMVNAGVWRMCEPCDTALMRKILEGFEKSKRLPRYFRDVLSEIFPH